MLSIVDLNVLSSKTSLLHKDLRAIDNTLSLSLMLKGKEKEMQNPRACMCT